MSSLSEHRPLYERKANLFKGLAHPYRIRILELLSAARDGESGESREVSVARLLEETELEASHLSQHLAVLRRHGLVLSQRRASHVYYRLAHPQVASLLSVVRELLHATLEADEALRAEAAELPEVGR